MEAAGIDRRSISNGPHAKVYSSSSGMPRSCVGVAALVGITSKGFVCLLGLHGCGSEGQE
jgi:hypothetical protein